MNNRCRLTHEGLAVCASVIAMLLITSGRANAQPASSHPLDRIAVGDRITVRDTQGRLTRGIVEGVSASGLRMASDNGTREWTLPDLVDVRRRGDSLKNGALWGAIGGGGVAAVLGGTIFSLCANEGGRNCPRLKVMSTVAPLAGGVGIGVLIDALRRGETIVYRRSPTISVVPLLQRRGAGATVGLTF